jgi:sugar-specific transcriptional regulator TrmB
MKTNVLKSAEDRVDGLSRIKETEEFTQLEELYKQGIIPVKKEDISASLKGKSNISNHLREIIQNANKEVIICTHVDDLKSKLKIFQQTFKRLEDNKIKIKCALSGDEAQINKLGTQLGTKLKKINIDAKFFIVDRKEILFYTSKNGEKEDIAIWLNSEFFSEAFASLFDKALQN